MKLITIILAISFVSASLSAQISPPTIVACVGNSITAGGSTFDSYVPPLSKLLGSRYVVYNFGKSSSTTLKNGNYPYWEQSVFTNALNANADIITIMLGTNDAKETNWINYGSEFKSDYIALIDTLQLRNKKAQIYPVLPTPVCESNYGIQKEYLDYVIALIKEVANEKGLPLIDMNTPFLNLCSYFPDGIHPNAAGDDTIAAVISRSIVTPKTSSESRMIETSAPFSLNNNYPNPFNKSTQIEYSLGVNTKVELSIFDHFGRKITTLVSTNQSKGNYKVFWDAAELSTGVYIYQLKSNEFTEAKKMFLIKE